MLCLIAAENPVRVCVIALDVVNETLSGGQDTVRGILVVILIALLVVITL